METVLTYVLFAVGFVLIVKGGDWFVDGAAWVAEVTGIPKIIVGATIVSVATTLPEILISTVAAIEGHQILMSGVDDFVFLSQEKVGLAIGNGIGSVICNIAMIMAISLIFAPKGIERKKLSRKVVIFGVVLFALITLTRFGTLSTRGALILLVGFVVYIVENVKSSGSDSLNDEDPPSVDRKTIIRNLISLFLGAACLIGGSQLLVYEVTGVARNLGVSESLIGLTIMAIGTSLPELVMAITAVIKKQPSMSVGNVIGANIIDIALVLPICSFIYGGTLPVSQQNLYLDFPVCILVSAIAFVPTLIAKKFYRWQGILMLVIYIAYLCLTVFRSEWYLSLFN